MDLCFMWFCRLWQVIVSLFGSAFATAFRQILNFFFFLLKLSAVCTFWIVLMC